MDYKKMKMYRQLEREAGEARQRAFGTRSPELKKEHEAARVRADSALLEILNYINGIDDCLTRRILLLRYVDGYTAEQTARRISRSYTAEAVRQICSRQLRR